MSDPRITVTLLNRADRAQKAVLSEAWGKQWQDPLNDTGTGKCVLANDDANLALVNYGDFLQFSLDGTIRFCSIVEQMDRVDIAPGEEADEATTLSGRGILALLEDAVMYPGAFYDGVPFADANVFNFASIDTWADTTTGGGFNASPYDFGDRASAGIYAGMPADFPPVFSHWIGGAAPNGSGTNPVGDWYYFALVLGLPDGLYRLFVGYDDAIDLWINDVPILVNDGATVDVTKTVDVFLASSFHFIAARIANHTGPDPNPSGLTAALCTLNADGTVDTEWWATDPSDINQSVLVTGYPSEPPGVTPGSFVSNQIHIAADLHGVNSVALISEGFSATVDSNGATWADDAITPSFQIGTDLLTTLKQLGESYFDFWVDPATFTLNLYQTRGSASGVSYAAADNITDLKHTGQF